MKLNKNDFLEKIKNANIENDPFDHLVMTIYYQMIFTRSCLKIFQMRTFMETTREVVMEIQSGLV